MRHTGSIAWFCAVRERKHGAVHYLDALSLSWSLIPSRTLETGPFSGLIAASGRPKSTSTNPKIFQAATPSFFGRSCFGLLVLRGFVQDPYLLVLWRPKRKMNGGYRAHSIVTWTKRPVSLLGRVSSSHALSKEESEMAADEKVLLRNVLVELRSIRFRLDRQVAVVQRLIKLSQKPTTKKKIGKKKTKTVKNKGKTSNSSSVGYVKERKVLARRLRKKTLR